MALRAGYYGVKRFLRDKLEKIAGTYDETIKSLFPRSEQAVLGATNRLPNKGNSTTSEGITWTVNADKTVTANGTKSNNDAGFKILDRSTDNYHLPGGKYILSGNAGANCHMLLQATRGGQLVNLGDITDSSHEIEVDIQSTDILQCVLFVNANKTVSNVVFKPMLSLLSDTDPTYAPYAMTNKELTDSASDQKTAINAIITAATGAADFAAFKTAIGAITPVTRSLSLTKEDITEEVKEDVEPEKTVTKKRTTKKTEEV